MCPVPMRFPDASPHPHPAADLPCNEYRPEEHPYGLA
ncbi:hypothetical protein BFL34_00905 [Clavibacter michiganensis]|jgi:hypothetical protein|uniref:Uncharacterized protein n=1 Tax=Clavibacter michiganensis TaxID=28447 RepID=A0A251YBW1_9MICO|nr:hypothetical protein BFL34_00905 [Clavibacter michiganensis]